METCIIKPRKNTKNFDETEEITTVDKWYFKKLELSILGFVCTVCIHVYNFVHILVQWKKQNQLHWNKHVNTNTYTRTFDFSLK